MKKAHYLPPTSIPTSLNNLTLFFYTSVLEHVSMYTDTGGLFPKLNHTTHINLQLASPLFFPTASPAIGVLDFSFFLAFDSVKSKPKFFLIFMLISTRRF